MVAGDATISRLMVQNVLHPGLSEVYNELLTAGEGNEIYVRSGEPVAGRTLAELAAERPRRLCWGCCDRIRSAGTCAWWPPRTPGSRPATDWC